MERSRCWSAAFAACLLLSVVPPGTSVTAAQEDSGHAIGRSLQEMDFAAVPGLPECSTAALQSGDPATGPSILLAKADKGCTIPWHWHTPEEHLMMVKGAARVDARDGQSITLRSGGYARLPPKHVHRFTCTDSCVFFVHSNAAFDIHYVDEAGAEIPLEEALDRAPTTGR
jgi:quercetin dioxygenase-like cupin family protein